MTAAGASATGRPAPPRRRRWPWVLGVLALLGLAGWWWVDRQLEPERLAATVLARLGTALDLELTIDGTPEYALRPEPRLVLPGLVARMPGATTPLLTAERVEVSLPWATILDGENVVITRIQLDRPVLDLAQLSAWLEARPASDEPFELPTLTHGLVVDEGRVVGDGWNFEDLSLALPELRPGAAVALELGGLLRRADIELRIDGRLALEQAAAVSPLSLELEYRLDGKDFAIPGQLQLTAAFDASGDDIRLDGFVLEGRGQWQADDVDATFELDAGGDFAYTDDGISLQPLQLALDGESPLPDLAASGLLRLGDEASTLELAGKLTQWPDAWPALPPPLVAAEAPLDFRMAYAGGADLGAPLTLDVEREGTTLHSVLVLPDMLAWLEADAASVLPPMTGELTTESLVIGGVTLEGVRVRVVDDAPGETSIGPEGPPTSEDDEGR